MTMKELWQRALAKRARTVRNREYQRNYQRARRSRLFATVGLVREKITRFERAVEALCAKLIE